MCNYYCFEDIVSFRLEHFLYESTSAEENNISALQCRLIVRQRKKKCMKS